MAVLHVDNVSKRFGAVAAVDRVSFEVGRGQIVSLLGPSGCGKTTTLRLIAGFEQPDAGTVYISGLDNKGKRPYERNVGLLFQDYALFPHMTVEQNILFGMRHRNVPRDEISGRTERLLGFLKLDGLEGRYPAQLSGGQKQRTALARALATEPDLLLLDEPLSALDAKLREELRVELKDILAKAGCATIIVTHDQEEAMGLSDSILVMNEGRIVQKGNAYDIYHRPSNRFVASFIGHSNWFAGTLSEEASHHPGVRLLRGDDGLALYVPAPPEPGSAFWEVCVRPEQVALATSELETAEAEPMNRLRGTVDDVTDLGSSLRFHVSTPAGHKVTAIRPASRAERPRKGDAVLLTFSPHDCVLMPVDRTAALRPPS